MRVTRAELTSYEGIALTVTRRPVRNVRMHLDGDCKLSVVAPRGYDVSAFLDEKRDWILSHAEKMRARNEKAEELSEIMLFFGEKYSVSGLPDSVSGSADKKKRQSFIDKESRIIYYSSTRDFVNFVNISLKRYVDEHLPKRALEMGVADRVGSVVIRRQKTRWGSCSSKGNLNFNIRLAALPPELIDYLFVHELAHIIEANHSDRFWAVVEDYCPEYKKYRKSLAEYWSYCRKNVFWQTIT